MTLGEKERLLSEVEKEREVWRQRDRALATVLQEKDVAIGYLKQELERRHKGEQVMVTRSKKGAVFIPQLVFFFFFKFQSFSLIISQKISLNISV